MKILCLINARSGSKGVPNKNIKLLNKKPLIAWSIELAKSCENIDRIIVSTESNKIANISVEFGAEVPFFRPTELATDKALQFDVIYHALNFMKNKGYVCDAVLLLQPTCPLRKKTDIEGCISLMEKTNADTVIAVVKESESLINTLYYMKDESNLTEYIETKSKGILRQDYNSIYRRVGTVYLIKSEVILEQKKLYGDNLKGYPVSPETAFNIDTIFDWKRIEAWLNWENTEINYD